MNDPRPQKFFFSTRVTKRFRADRPKPSQRSVRRQLICETLEDRTLLAVLLPGASGNSVELSTVAQALVARASSGEQLRVIVEVQPDALQAVSSIAGLNGGTIIRQFESLPLVAMQVDAAALIAMLSLPSLVSITEDSLSPPALDNSLPVINVPPVQDLGLSGSGLAVAILDTGIDRNHPFFGGRVVEEACYSNAGGGGSGVSLCPSGNTSQTGLGAAGILATHSSVFGIDHGQHVAGIVAGDGTGVTGAPAAGVAPGAEIIAVQVFTRFDDTTTCSAANQNTPCLLAYTSDIIAGLQRVHHLSTTRTIAAANLSLGGGAYSSTCDAQQPAIKTVIDSLRNVNIATIVASGNNGFSNAINYPACISTAISVGRTDNSDAVVSSGNRGPLLDLFAPGSGIRSAVLNNSYGSKSGTSMSAPHVAGAWAVLRQANPSLTVSEILNLLQDTGLPINYASGTTIVTTPRIDLLAAIEELGTVVDRLDWSEVGRQTVGTSFPVTITAHNSQGATVTDFENPVSLSAWAAADLESVSIGQGTSSFTYPLHSSYHDSRTQVIYLQNEIGNAAMLTGLALDVVTVPGQTLHDWTIRMKHTPLSSYSSPSLHTSGWTTVYQSHETISQTGWVDFVFPTPFEYNGVDNLMVDFSYNNSSFTSNGQVRSTNIGTTRTARARSDSNHGDPLTWSGTTAPSVTGISHIPNLRLTAAELFPVSITPTVSGAFVNGAWTGSVTVHEPANSMWLRASSSTGRLGNSDPFQVIVGASPGLTANLADGTLTISDIYPDNRNNVLTVEVSGDSLVVRDAQESFDVAPDGGVLSDGNRTLTIPMAMISGSLVVELGGGDDVLTIDFTGGNPIPAGGLNYDGGTGNDSLELLHGTFHTTDFTYLSDSGGSIRLDVNGDGLTVFDVMYSGLEAIQSAISGNVVQMNYTGDDETIAVSTASTTQTLVNSTSGVSTTFVNPSELLAINATEGKDIIELHSLAADFPSLQIAGTDASDVVRVLGSLTFAENQSVIIQDVGAVDLLNSASKIAVKGSGSVSLTSFQRIRLDSGAAITAVDGDTSLSANQQAISPDGPFVGVSLDNATIHSSGLGNIVVAGRGGGSIGNGNHGVRVVGGGSILSSGGGSISVNGVGGASSGSFNIGVLVRDPGSQITSNNGPIHIEGYSHGLTGVGGNIGVYLHTQGLITHTGTNPNHGVTVIGGGGAGLGENHGVWVKGVGSRIISSLGPIVVEGSGGTAGTSPHHGVFVSEGGAIRNLGAVGTASATVRGLGGNATATAWGNRGVYVTDPGSEIFTDGGLLRIEGTGGGFGASHNHDGIAIAAAAHIISDNSDVTLIGIGGNGTGTSNHGVSLHGAGTLVRARGGDVIVAGTAGAGSGGFGVNVEASSWMDASEGDNIRLTADAIRLATTAVLSADSDAVFLRTQTLGAAIALGEADSVGTLGLTNAELARITAGTIVIGDATGGAITLADEITLPQATHMELRSGSRILFDTGSINTAGGNLLLVPGTGGVQPVTAGTDVSAGTVSFASTLTIAIEGTTVDTQHSQLNVLGAVDLDGVNLALTGDYLPALGDEFMIVSATSVMGQFNGLSEGSQVSFGGVPLTVRYTATAVTLSTLSVTPTIRYFDFDHATSPVTAGGYQSVLIGDRYSPELGYGWSGSVSAVQRAATLVPLDPPELFQDKHSSSSPRSFIVSAEPGRMYNIRVFLGDTVFRDQEISVDGGATFTRFTTNPHEYIYPLFTEVVATSDRLEVQVRRISGSWAINGIEVIDATGGLFTNENLEIPPVLLIGMVHPFDYTEIVPGEYWVSSNLATVLDGGANAINRTSVASSGPDAGRLTFSLQSHFAGASEVVFVSVDGLTRYELDTSFEISSLRRLDMDHGTEPATANTYQSVLPSNLYSAAIGYGWSSSVASLTRDASLVSIDPAALFQDKHTSSNLRSFFVAAEAGRTYNIRVFVGDTIARDQEISVDGGATFTRFTTGPNQYLYPVFADVEATSDRLEIRVRRVTGSWVINGIEVIDVTGQSSSTFTLPSPPPLQTTRVHPLSYSGIVTGEYWVSADLGQVLDTDAAPIYRVTIPASGEWMFAVQSVLPGANQVVLVSDDGLIRYELPLSFVAPTHRGWDFDHAAGVVTMADFQSVLPGDLYSTEYGYGWNASVASLTRDASLVSIDPAALFQDKHTSSNLRSFFVAAEAGRTYNIRVFVGDTIARDQEISVDGGATFTRFTTGPNQYLYPVFAGVEATSDRLEIRVRHVTGSWVINGIEVIDVTGQSFSDTTLTWSQPLETSTLHSLTFTGIATGDYWVSTDSGRLLDASNQTMSQVVIPATGEFAFKWQGYVPGAHSVRLVSPDGLVTYELTADFFLPAARFYDFDHSTGTITTDGYQSVGRTELYTLERGYGWSGSVGSLNRTTAAEPFSLFRDKHHSSNPRSFFVMAEAGVGYDLRFHLGDTAARDLEISVDGGLTFTRYTTAAHEYISPEISGLIMLGDRLEIQIRSVGSVSWAINGLEVREAASGPIGMMTSDESVEVQTENLSIDGSDTRLSVWTLSILNSLIDSVEDRSVEAEEPRLAGDGLGIYKASHRLTFSSIENEPGDGSLAVAPVIDRPAVSDIDDVFGQTDWEKTLQTWLKSS